MNFGSLRSLAFIATLALTLPALAQTSDNGAKQDMKNAGTDTKHAATSAGHGVSEGSKTAYDKTKSGTEKGYDKTKSGTEKGTTRQAGEGATRELRLDTTRQHRRPRPVSTRSRASRTHQPTILLNRPRCPGSIHPSPPLPRWAATLKFCHPDRSVAQGRDLQFALVEKRNPEATRPRHFRCAWKA